MPHPSKADGIPGEEKRIARTTITNDAVAPLS